MFASKPKPNRRIKPKVSLKRDALVPPLPQRDEAPQKAASAEPKPSAPRRTPRRRKQTPGGITFSLKHLLWGLGFLAAYLLFVAVFFLWQEIYVFVADKHYFDLRQIEVSGLKQATREEILAYSGLTIGASVFDVDLARARQGVERHPWVRRAGLSRRLPDGVVITVSENTPKALLALDDKLYLVNDEGTPFKPVAEGEPAAQGLVRIEGLSQADIEPLEKGQRRLSRALELIAAYNGHAMATLAPLNKLLFRYDGFELLVGPGPTTLVLGRRDDARVFDRAAKLWRYLAEHGQEPEVIHLDNRPKPERVSVRLKSLEAPKDAATPGSATTQNNGGRL